MYNVYNIPAIATDATVDCVEITELVKCDSSNTICIVKGSF